METKLFGDKKITIRAIQKSDLKKAPEFLKFINSFVEEGAMLTMNKKISLKEEKEFLKEMLRGSNKKDCVYLVAECGKEIAGTSRIVLGKGSGRHVGTFGITIYKDYRGIGLGKYLMSEIIKFAKKQLKELKIINLQVFAENKPAVSLYKKMGFKIAGKIPKQRVHKGKLSDEFIMFLYPL